MNKELNNLRRRERRHERQSNNLGNRCNVCHLYDEVCACSGARLFLRFEVLKLQAEVQALKATRQRIKTRRGKR